METSKILDLVDRVRIGSYLSLKASYSLLKRNDNNSLRASMIFTTRKLVFIKDMENIFNKYTIKYCIIKRKLDTTNIMYSIKVSGKENLRKYFSVFGDDIIYEDENYKKVYHYVFSKIYK
jgi:hypothetical protein